MVPFAEELRLHGFQQQAEAWSSSWRAGIRFGFSVPWMIASTVEFEFTMATAMGRVGPTWSSMQPVFETLEDRAAEGMHPMNPLASVYGSTLRHEEAHRLDQMMTIAALRMAVADALGEELVLPNPFTSGSLRVKHEGATTLYWSVGRDGRDDGGDKKSDVVFQVTR